MRGLYECRGLGSILFPWEIRRRLVSVNAAHKMCSQGIFISTKICVRIFVAVCVNAMRVQ